MVVEAGDEGRGLRVCVSRTGVEAVGIAGVFIRFRWGLIRDVESWWMLRSV